MYTYDSPYEKTTWKAPSAPAHDSDPNLTSANLQKGYLTNTLLPRYVYVSLKKMKEIYNLNSSNFDEHNIQNYYIEVQGMYIVFGSRTKKGKFLVRNISQHFKDDDNFTSADVSSTTSSTCAVYNDDAEPAKCKDAGVNRPSRCGQHKCQDIGNCVSPCCEYVSAKDATCNTYYTTYSHEAKYCGIKVFHRILGTYYEGKTSLAYTASAGGQSCDSTTDVVKANLVDIIDEMDEKARVKHCILSDDQKEYTQHEIIKKEHCTNGFEYYIGPNQDKALIGTKNNKYNLYGTKTNDGNYKNNCRYGVKHYYVMDATTNENLCNSVCGSITNKRSDNYFMCAENYCENDVDYNLNGAPFIRKRKCMINTCGYIYGYEPLMKTNADKDNSKKKQAESSCANSTIFKNSNTEYGFYSNTASTSSVCSIYNNNDISNNIKRISTCYGDKITDYDGEDGNDTNFDTRSYVNVACEETSKITSLTDISKQRLSPGDPVAYSLNVRGTIRCIVFFNYEQWKFDYATIPRKDKVRKSRMQFIYNKFNNLLVEGYTTPKINGYDYENPKTETSQRLESILNDYKHKDVIVKIDENSNEKKEKIIDANLNIKEYQVDGSLKETNENPLTEIAASTNYSKSTIDLRFGAYKTYNNLTNGGYLYSVEDYRKVLMTTSKNSILQGYILTSTINKSYVTKKYCTDYSGTTSEASSDGKCENGTDGKNNYYISYSAKSNSKFSEAEKRNGDYFETKLITKRSLPDNINHSLAENVYNNTDMCKYIVNDNDGYSCSISCDAESPIGYGNYLNKLNVRLITYKDGVRYKGKDPTIDIKSEYGMRAGFITYNSKFGISANINNFANINKYGNEKFYITGSFTDENNQKHNCYNSCSVLNYISDDVSCTIEKKGNKYEVKPKNANKVGIIIVKDVVQTDDIIELSKDSNGKYTITIDDSNVSENLLVIGHVSNGRIGAVCLYPSKKTNCKTMFNPGEKKNIYDYCVKNFKNDVNNFTDPDDCYKKCSSCPDEIEPLEDSKTNIEINKEFIKEKYCGVDNYSILGYPSSEECIAQTYKECVKTEPYIYRPININNPFPSAVESSIGYSAGTRPIGTNWQGKSNYIKDAYEKKETPDYFVTLDPATINQLKSKIYSLENAGELNIYTKEMPIEDNNSNGKSVDTNNRPYRSRLINKEFRKSFTYINGVNITNDTEN